MTDQTRAPSRRRRWAVPAMALAIVLGLAAAFPDLALLFVVAILIVYLIEPVVGALTRIDLRGRKLPRWAAVITVYTAMLGVTAGAVAVFAPVVAGEAAALAEEVPRFAQHAQERYVPAVNEHVRALRTMFAPVAAVEAPVGAARDRVADALDRAGLEALFVSTLDAEEVAAYRSGGIVVSTEVPGGTPEDGVLIELRPTEDGGLNVLAPADGLTFQRTGDDQWTVRRGPPIEPAAGAPDMDIAKAVTDSFGLAVESSGRQVSEVLQLGQRLIGRLVSALVGLFVTFMVAAFISVDAPRVVSFVTGLFPSDQRPAVVRLLQRLNHGLSGVIRGQVAICFINAFLTGLGLMIFKVKFALLLALVAGLFSLIPIFGTILSTIPCVLLALPQGIGTAFLVVTWIIVIHFIEANILQPKIMGTTARIHPAAVILALVAGEHAYGPVGALVAVPVVSVIQSILFFARDELSHGEADAETESEPTKSDATVDTDAPAADDGVAPGESASPSPDSVSESP